MDDGDEESARRVLRGRNPLPLEEAIRACSDPEALRRLDEVHRYRHPPMIFFVGPGVQPDAYELAHSEWCRLFKPLNEAFLAKLKSGALAATGFAQPLTPHSRRERIAKELFELLELDYEKAEAKHGDLIFTRVEVSEQSDADALREEPETGEVEAKPPPELRTFKHNSTYSRVSIGRHEFFLTGGQCAIVKALHAASGTDDPWVANKNLLGEGNYNSDTISGVFKRHKTPPWQELIDQRRGFSRLKV